MTKASDNVFPKVELAEGAAPGTPSAAQVRLYAKADGLLYSKDDAGTETLVSGGSGAGLSDQGTFTYLDATEAAAPATPSAGTVRIYSKTDGLLYSKDDAGVETLVSGGAGGGGGGWTQVLSLDGTTVAGGTVLSGTWASSGGRIQQTASGGSVRRWRYDTRLDLVDFVVRATVRFPTGGAATRSAGIILGWLGTDVANYMAMQLVFATTAKFQLSQDALNNPLDETVTVNVDTDYVIQARVSGKRVAGYLDGTLKGVVNFGGSVQSTNYLAHFIGLRAFDATVEFDDIGVWVPTLPS